MFRHTNKSTLPSCQIKQEQTQVNVPHKKPNTHFFYPNNNKDIKKLEQYANHCFKYDAKINPSNKKADILIAPNAVLNGELAIYSAKDLNINLGLGYYTGPRSQDIEQKREGAVYVFSIVDENNEVIEDIDAEKIGDWTRYLNHSPTPNLIARQTKKNGRSEIKFTVAQSIPKGRQIFFDYGENYFVNLLEENHVKPFYLHSTDTWVTAEENYHQYSSHYATGTYSFDEKTHDDFQLNCKEWLLPLLFQYIHENNVTKLKESLEAGCPVDLLAYSFIDGQIAPSANQQHITALMFACYLGRKECIEMLIKHGADANRCMLVAGYTPLTLLLLGYGGYDLINDFILSWLDNPDLVPHPFITDSHNLMLQHYAIARNFTDIITKLLAISKEMGFDIYETLYPERKENKASHQFYNFEYCLIKNYLDILSIFMEDIPTGKLLKLLETDNLFDHVILLSTEEQLKILQDILSSKRIKIEYSDNQDDQTDKCIELLDKLETKIWEIIKKQDFPHDTSELNNGISENVITIEMIEQQIIQACKVYFNKYEGLQNFLLADDLIVPFDILKIERDGPYAYYFHILHIKPPEDLPAGLRLKFSEKVLTHLPKLIWWNNNYNSQLISIKNNEISKDQQLRRGGVKTRLKFIKSDPAIGDILLTKHVAFKIVKHFAKQFIAMPSAPNQGTHSDNSVKKASLERVTESSSCLFAKKPKLQNSHENGENNAQNVNNMQNNNNIETVNHCSIEIKY